MYSRSSNALKNEYYTYEQPRKLQNKNKTEALKIKKAQNALLKAQTANKLKKQRIVAAVGMIAVMAFTVLFRYAAIAKEFSDLSEAKSELALYNAKVIEKEMEAEGNVDPKRIEKEAERLGLQQPEQSQIKYISLGNKDNGEVLKNENSGIVSAFISKIGVILEYLY